MEPITVIITGAGAPGAPGIIKCLRKNGERPVRIIGVDVKKRVGTMPVLDEFITVCPASSPDFCDVMLSVAQKVNANIIMPLVTRELECFADNIERFERIGVKVCVCPIDSLHIANDKGLMLDALDKNKVPVPKYIRIRNAADFASACKKLGFPDHAVCFKPSVSNGSRGFRVISPSVDRAKLLFNEKPSSVYISFEEADQILKSMDAIPELLVMEYLPGDEYSIDMLADNGKTLICVPRKRLSMNGGISVNCVIENNRQIIDYCEEIVRVLKLDGNIGVQVRADRNGEYRILEINPRVQGTIVACNAAGVNLPYLSVKRKLGEPFPTPDIKWNVEMIRFWDETYFADDGTVFTV